jgi:hypothetical protein
VFGTKAIKLGLLDVLKIREMAKNFDIDAPVKSLAFPNDS